jgi:hypothetical protein
MSPSISKKHDDFTDSNGKSSVFKKRSDVKIAVKATGVITCFVFFVCFISGVFDAPVAVKTERLIRAPPADFLKPDAACADRLKEEPISENLKLQCEAEGKSGCTYNVHTKTCVSRKKHFAIWNDTELYGSKPVDMDQWIEKSTHGHNVFVRHANIMDILRKSNEVFQRRIHMWLRVQPVGKGIRLNGWALKSKFALMKAPDMVKFKVITEFIKKSEPALHTHMLKWMTDVRPKQDRFYEEVVDTKNQPKKREHWEIFNRFDWIQIKKDMRHMKSESEALIRDAKKLDEGATGDILERIGNAFLHIHTVVTVDCDGPEECFINFWDWEQDKIREYQSEVYREHNLEKKRKLLAEKRDQVKCDWESFIESEVRRRLSYALDQPELDTTIGDNLKRIRAHPTHPLPKSFIERIEKMIHLQFMDIGSKIRFMKWDTLEDAAGMEW